MFLFIVVQANGLPPTSFPLSSLLSSPHNPSKLNNKIIEEGLFFQCVTAKTHICLQILETYPWEDFHK